MTYFILFLLFMFMIFLFTFKGNVVGTIPLGKVQSISYSQSFFINYTHIKTDKHTILLGHKMTNIKEDDELLMKRFQFKKMICNLSRKSPEYAIESINMLDSLYDFLSCEDESKTMAYTKEKQNAIKLKNKIKAFQRKQKILHNKRYWNYHQRGIRKAKKHHWIGYLDFFTIERNYKLIKLFSSTIK